MARSCKLQMFFCNTARVYSHLHSRWFLSCGAHCIHIGKRGASFKGQSMFRIPMATTSSSSTNIEFKDYEDESQLEHVMKLVTKDLSEPYSIFTYRYFLHRFPDLCILAYDGHEASGEPIGCVVGKLDQEELLVAGVPQQAQTGYIGMLAVQSSYRRQGIGKALVKQVLKRMKEMGCKSVTLETEVSNTSAQRLYQDSFGFVREELLVRYYLNFNDAFRLRLWLEEEKKM